MSDKQAMTKDPEYGIKTSIIPLPPHLREKFQASDRDSHARMEGIKIGYSGPYPTASTSSNSMLDNKTGTSEQMNVGTSDSPQKRVSISGDDSFYRISKTESALGQHPGVTSKPAHQEGSQSLVRSVNIDESIPDLQCSSRRPSETQLPADWLARWATSKPMIIAPSKHASPKITSQLPAVEHIVELRGNIDTRIASHANTPEASGTQNPRVTPAQNDPQPTDMLSKTCSAPGPPAAFFDKWQRSKERVPVRHPTRTAGAVTFGAPTSSEDLEHAQTFKAWPMQDTRDRRAAEIRTVIIRGLPTGTTLTFVMSLVYGGPLERITLRESTSSSSVLRTASIRFLHVADCQRFYDDTSNGIVYGHDLQKRKKVVFVELGKEVDVVGGQLSQWISIGASRCVRAVPVEEDFGCEYLWKLAAGQSRKVEGMEEGKTANREGGAGGRRYVVWRFCDIKEAVAFKASLARDEDWEMCNVTFADDPCALARGIHLGA